MRILALADEPCKALWDFYDETKLKDIDLILSAGDLPPEYLSFLVTFSNCPVLYVHGNHDEKYETKPPEGCTCIDDMIYVHEGIRILGLGGSMRYRPGNYQFTDKEMNKRIRKLRLSLWRHHGFDILLTHAPGKGLGDLEDLPHQGFEAFPKMLDKYNPKYMVHGHVHMNYGANICRTLQYNQTQIINAFESYVIDY